MPEGFTQIRIAKETNDLLKAVVARLPAFSLAGLGDTLLQEAALACLGRSDELLPTVDVARRKIGTSDGPTARGLQAIVEELRALREGIAPERGTENDRGIFLVNEGRPTYGSKKKED